MTDAPKHNLAIMKLSTYHKQMDDTVQLNNAVGADIVYGSILFEQNITTQGFNAVGGPAFNGSLLEPSIEKCKPDYTLYPKVDYSLGYTFRPCWSNCDFCKVPKMNHPDTDHHSIWEFHDERFDTICLMNNNTFLDPQWKETFEEIWDAKLKLRDENGYDLRLIDDEKADALHRTPKASPLHFAWDRMNDEPLIVEGLKTLGRHKLRNTRHGVYVLIGYNTTEQEDLHRCQVIVNHGLTPYPMPYVKNDYTRKFKRFMNLFYFRKYKTVEAAWKDYRYAKKT